MHLRELPSQTLGELREEIGSVVTKTIEVPISEVKINLTKGDPLVTLPTAGKRKDVVVPATPQGVKAFADRMKIPAKFLDRLDPDLQEYLLKNIMKREGGHVKVLYTFDSVQLVRDIKTHFISPLSLVDVAAKVIDSDSLVSDYWLNNDEFRLDVIVPDDFDRGIGGDPKVGDITKAGIRIGQDVKNNLVPWVSEFLYRLICTNGIEIFDAGLKVDARGLSVDEVLWEFEVIADRAFKRVEDSISAFYELQEKKVDNPERTLIRIAEEQGLPDRTTVKLAELIPSIEADEITMFDIINLFTSAANDPQMKDGPRRTLQLVGGGIVTEHASRCPHCQSKLD